MAVLDSTNEAADIPVIDISLSSDKVAKDLLDAAATYGFVFVKNHGICIQPGDIDGMFNLSREFFQSPMEVKQEATIHSKSSGKNRGFLSMGTERLDPSKHKRGDFKEAFNLGEFRDGKAMQPLPGPLANEEARLAQFAEKCHELCNQILQLFAKALEIPAEEGGETWFSQRHDRSKGPSSNVLRLLYYPAVDSLGPYDASADIRAGAHSDYGSITLLFRLPGQPGLEILDSTSKWVAVPLNPLQDPDLPILVNTGDLLSYWTNGLLKSTVHRVTFPVPDRADNEDTKVAPQEDRYSIAYFCHPLDESKLAPVPSKRVEERKELVKKESIGFGGGIGMPGEDGVILTAKGHLDRRLQATYELKE